jgi:glycosyltransferase involved in cell wall biosynthesis
VSSPLRVALDATPLLGQPTGVGRYVAGLLGGLARLAEPPETLVTAFTVRGARDLPVLAARAGAPAAKVVRRRAPARLLHELWARGSLPPVEWLTGAVDVFHGTNFVLPPTRRAAGVVTVHDLAYEHTPELVSAASRRYRELVPRALDRADVVLTPSRAVADEVATRYGLAADRMVVTGLGVDDAWSEAAPLDARELAALGLPDRYLLFVGNREPRKGLSVLLRAHRLLREQEPDAPPLVLAGPAGWGEVLGDEPQDGVVVAGYLDDGILRRVVCGAACLVFPSRYEGFGLPPLEALAAGTPSVVTDLPVLREVLGTHADFVALDDDAGLAAALHQVVAAPPDDLRRRAGQEWAARWTWARCARDTVAAYQQALR